VKKYNNLPEVSNKAQQENEKHRGWNVRACIQEGWNER